MNNSSRSTVARRPPRSPHSSSSPVSSGQRSRSDSSPTTTNKSSKRNSSDSPSGSATNDHGRDFVDDRLRSVLCHPLGLPLLHAFNGGDPGTLPCLAKKRAALSDKCHATLDNLLLESVLDWREQRQKVQGAKKVGEEYLTKKVAENIEALSSQQLLSFHALPEVSLTPKSETAPYGRIDILLTPAKHKDVSNESAPYAVIEFGLQCDDWWKKLDQNAKYLNKMVEGNLSSNCLIFRQPVLLAVVTLDFEGNSTMDTTNGTNGTDNLRFKIGVFLCSRKDPDDRNDKFRVSLLWHDKSSDLETASKFFGRLLRVTHDFQHWISENDDTTQGHYQYLSSSCCKCKHRDGRDVVLRSYDDRFRKTNRSAEIYLADDCKSIVGGTETVVKLGYDDDKHCEEGSSFWQQKRGLTIIATPYREGKHFAAEPAAFIPIIRQLKKMHDKGYVHGDIRAFNTVFGEEAKEGWLIDFDFGGQAGEASYPRGYKKVLPDGIRLGIGEEKIQKLEDWYSLGQLIFRVHEFRQLKMNTGDLNMDERMRQLFCEFEDFFFGECKEPTDKQLLDLEEFLRGVSQNCLIISPVFQAELNAVGKGNTNTGAVVTAVGATGSPLK